MSKPWIKCSCLETKILSVRIEKNVKCLMSINNTMSQNIVILCWNKSSNINLEKK